MISSAIVYMESIDASTPSEPMSSAAAPSPKATSLAPFGMPSLQSATRTSTFFSEPLLTASTAARSALVPLRSEPAKSAVYVSGLKASTAAMVAAACFSL